MVLNRAKIIYTSVDSFGLYFFLLAAVHIR